MKRVIMLAALVVALILGGCANENGPVQTVEEYIRTRTEGDANKLQSLSCAEWEAQAANQAMSFRAASNASVEGMACSETGTDGDFTIVTCQGEVVTDYNGEVREWPLGAYRTIQEGGEWRVCGEG